MACTRPQRVDYFQLSTLEAFSPLLNWKDKEECRGFGELCKAERSEMSSSRSLCGPKISISNSTCKSPVNFVVGGNDHI